LTAPPHNSGYYEKSMAIEKRLGNRAGMARVYNQIGEIHKSQGRYARAMMFHEKSLAIEKQMGDRLGIAGTRLDMGIVAYRKGNLDIAIRHTEEALEVYRSLGSPHTKTAEKNLRIFRQREWR
jgi:tetratricopeptide (TPR) repeat protein